MSSTERADHHDVGSPSRSSEFRRAAVFVAVAIALIVAVIALTEGGDRQLFDESTAALIGSAPWWSSGAAS